MEAEKIIFLLWSPPEWDEDTRARVLLDKCAPQICHMGAAKLIIYVDDNDADVPSPAPRPFRERLITAQVEVWLDDTAQYKNVDKILQTAGYDTAAYMVRESIYREYGDNQYMHQRDWPDGKRSPGVVAVTLLKKPARLTEDQWVSRWHGIMSPVSEAIQPRTRYVRNLVVSPLTENAPVYNGIVIEAWPSKKHVSNYFLFYGARNIVQLIINMFKILKAVRSFLRIRDIRTVMMSEYFIKTDF